MCTSNTLDQLENDAYSALDGDDNIATGVPGAAAATAGPVSGVQLGATTSQRQQVRDSRLAEGLKGTTNNPNTPEFGNPPASMHSQTQEQPLNTTTRAPKSIRERKDSHGGDFVVDNAPDMAIKDAEDRLKSNGPHLEPGIVDYICVVGAKNIGDQRELRNGRGWVDSEPECSVLEQFPSNEFHKSNGR